MIESMALLGQTPLGRLMDVKRKFDLAMGVLALRIV